MTRELITIDGKGKYSTPAEQIRFLTVARELDRTVVRTFSMTPAYSDYRLSEALELTPDHFDSATKAVRFRTPKQRDKSFTKLFMMSIWTR